jgi:hypothetical protein
LQQHRFVAADALREIGAAVISDVVVQEAVVSDKHILCQ